MDLVPARHRLPGEVIQVRRVCQRGAGWVSDPTHRDAWPLGLATELQRSHERQIPNGLCVHAHVFARTPVDGLMIPQAIVGGTSVGVDPSALANRSADELPGGGLSGALQRCRDDLARVTGLHPDRRRHTCRRSRPGPRTRFRACSRSLGFGVPIGMRSSA